MRRLRESDVSMIVTALEIARIRFEADANECDSTGNKRLADQFAGQRNHAARLAALFDARPEVIIED